MSGAKNAGSLVQKQCQLSMSEAPLTLINKKLFFITEVSGIIREIIHTNIHFSVKLTQ